MSTPLLFPQSDLTLAGCIPRIRQRQDKRDSTGRKLVNNYSSEFLSAYVEWRKSRFEALPLNRKCDSGWYQALSNDHIWHQWFSNGLVQSETMLSRSALAHVYDNLKPKTTGTSLSIESTKRGPLVFRHACNTRFQLKKLIYFFCPQQLAARGRRPTSQPRSARRKICSTPSTATLHRQAQSRELRGQTS
jgi:hypothetical protein